MDDRHAPRSHWDRSHRERLAAGDDLDWGGRWTRPILPLMRRIGARRVLDLGCGTGHDAGRLVGAGFEVVGLDVSGVALRRAARVAPGATFVLGDVTAGIPFADGAFDAVMSNVALHLFSDRVTRAAFGEVRRITRPGGAFAFHVNAASDRPLRATRKPAVRELEPDFVLEEDGRTIRFFSEPYLRDVLTGWAEVTLVLEEIAHEETGEPFKRVWCGVARRPRRRRSR